MNPEKLADLTKALDVAIAKVAREQLAWLSSGLTHRQIARETHDALRSLQALARNEMPNYDDWVALFYLLWHQPSHVNLAYTLIRRIPEGKNPLRSAPGSLQVVDFGCGALAMQFGLALAAADALDEYRVAPQVAIVSEDSSTPMRDIGIRLWVNFVDEISDARKYPALDSLRSVCRTMRLDDGYMSGSRWLSALHVAYSETKAEVRSELDRRVGSMSPDLILVTFHPGVPGDLAYAPQKSEGYSKVTAETLYNEFELRGIFGNTSDLRKSLYHERVAGNLPDDDDDRFMSIYLTRYLTGWTIRGSTARVIRYKRSTESEDELPW